MLSTAPYGTIEVFEYLRECAKHMYTNNYQNICDEVKRRSNGAVKILPKRIGPPLGVIRQQYIDQKVPWLNALAVGINSKSRRYHWRPSHGFLPGESNWEPSHETLWRGMVIQVFSYDWNSVIVT